jgi:hypothetical protein
MPALRPAAPEGETKITTSFCRAHGNNVENVVCKISRAAHLSRGQRMQMPRFKSSDHPRFLGESFLPSSRAATSTGGERCKCRQFFVAVLNHPSDRPARLHTTEGDSSVYSYTDWPRIIPTAANANHSHHVCRSVLLATTFCVCSLGLA